MEKLDRETSKVMAKARKALSITSNEEWNELERVFMAKVMSLRLDIQGDTDKQWKDNARSQYIASEILLEFMNEVKGLAGSYVINEEVLREAKSSLYNYN